MLLADQNRLTRIGFPWVTTALMAACILLFLAELGGTPPPEILVFRPDQAFARPGDPMGWVGLVGHALLHGGVLHLFGNMLALWVFGDNVEDAFGHARYAAFLLAVAAAGALGFGLTAEPGIGLIGASGAIAGIMGSYLLLHPRARVAMLVLKGVPVSAPASWFVGLWLAGNLINAFAPGPGTLDDMPVAWFAHLGGFAAGLVLTLVARPADVALFQPGLAGDARQGLWKHVWHLGPRDGEGMTGAAIGRALLFVLLAGLGLLFAS